MRATPERQCTSNTTNACIRLPNPILIISLKLLQVHVLGVFRVLRTRGRFSSKRLLFSPGRLGHSSFQHAIRKRFGSLTVLASLGVPFWALLSLRPAWVRLGSLRTLRHVKTLRGFLMTQSTRSHAKRRKTWKVTRVRVSAACIRGFRL